MEGPRICRGLGALHFPLVGIDALTLEDLPRRTCWGLLSGSINSCINQRNAEEKSRQIRLMKDIYLLAMQAVMWLGPKDDSTRGGLELIQQVATSHVENPG